MTSGVNTRSSKGVPRRTVTRTAAWSVPAVTTVLAAPTLAASASETVDLAVESQPFGDTFAAYSPDRYQIYEMMVPGGFDATNMGAVDVPAGAVVALSFDSRVASGASLEADGVAVPAEPSGTNGNVTTVSFSLPMALPAGATVSLRPTLTRMEPAPWATDIEPYTVAISPPAGTQDSVAGNNSTSMQARYHETNDAQLSATWRQHDLVTEAGDPLPIDVQDTLTITANAPGDVPSGSSLTVGGPSVYDGSEYVDVYEEVSIVSAVLDGQDVTDQFELQPSSSTDDRRTWRIGVAIPAGQELVVDVDVTVATSTREYVYSGAWTQFFSARDRDEDNNRADTGPTP